MKGNLWAGWSMALFANFALSTIAPVGRIAISMGISPTTLLLARFGLATICLGITYYLTKSKLHFKPINHKGILICIVAGLFNSGSSLAFFWALSHIQASVGAMIFSIYPLLVLIILFILGEKLVRLDFFRLALGIAGIYLLVDPSGKVSVIGIVLALFTALCSAIYLIIIQIYLYPYGPRAVAYYVVATALITSAIFWLIQGSEWNINNWQGWAAVVMLAFVGTYFARLASISAVNKIGSAQFALLAPFDTLLAVLWSLTFIQAKLTILQWIGGLLIISSVLLVIQRLKVTQLQIYRK